MRKALVVGINHYANVRSLHGCVADATAVQDVLEFHGNGDRNFEVAFLAGAGPKDVIDRARLKTAVRDLFSGDPEIALFYFAGHGYVEMTGGYLCGSDCSSGDDGLPLGEVLTLAKKSAAKNKVIVLDSCHSGVAGNSPDSPQQAELTEGMTILAASTEDQYATEKNGRGVFTTLFVDALKGGAANLVGDVTPGSIYAHIDQSLGAWEKQRPVFKTNVKSFVSLRKVPVSLTVTELRRLTDLFPTEGHVYPLDPTYEPERPDPNPPTYPPPDPAHTEVFAVLQKLNRVGVVVPLAPHMWHAAMWSKGCRLTPLGEHYRRLVERKRI